MYVCLLRTKTKQQRLSCSFEICTYTYIHVQLYALPMCMFMSRTMLLSL